MTSPVSETLSALSLSDNPGLSSGHDTPQTSHTDTLLEEEHDDARVTTPFADHDGSDCSHVDELVDELVGDDNLDDGDPILHHIAHTQHGDQVHAPFRARPAPANTFIEGVGPRLTKAAALRQGLEWDDPRDTRRALGEEYPVAFDNVPGHKRSGLALNVASLAEPAHIPRQNRAALLRMGLAVDGPVRNVAEITARNKAKELAERHERRRSVVPPQSLSSPDVQPRQNRAALLRLGQLPTSHGRDPRQVAEQAVLNKEREAAERLAKRKAVTLPASLAAPTITPRANRASMLRTGDLAATPRPSTSRPSSAAPRASSDPRMLARLTGMSLTDNSGKGPRHSTISPLRSLATPVITPRANKASKLREKTPAAPPPSSSRRSSTSSLTSMSTGTSKLNPPKPQYPMPSPQSRYTAPRPAPLPPRHKPTPSVSSEVSAAVEAVGAEPAATGSERRNSIFRRLNPRHSISASSSSSSETRSQRSSIIRDSIGAKIASRART